MTFRAESTAFTPFTKAPLCLRGHCALAGQSVQSICVSRSSLLPSLWHVINTKNLGQAAASAIYR